MIHPFALLACTSPSDNKAPETGLIEDTGVTHVVTAWDKYGATTTGSEVAFRIPSRHAERVEVWLYDQPFGTSEVAIVELQRHGTLFEGNLDVAHLPSPLWYGLRVWGPNWKWDADWSPGSEVGFLEDVDVAGNRFNPNKLIWDPYARELSHDPTSAHHWDWNPYTSSETHRTTDTASFVPKGLILPDIEVDTGQKPRHALRDSVIYEVHVRGLTKQDPSVPEELQGTYAGAALKADYLASLGITAIEFLPVHETQNEQNEFDPTSTDGDNYWGYSTLSFFAPDRRYAADQSPGGPTREFREMVRAFHDAGIEVFLDVVYNHTGEGNVWDAEGQVAPLLSWRGLDNQSFYEVSGSSYYRDDNGVGPNVNVANALSREMVLASLKYWSETMGVDGFRFDLASILGNSCERDCYAWDPNDPGGILMRAPEEVDAHLIAEPWAITSYLAGQFPDGWAEWNDGYRDLIRKKQNRIPPIRRRGV